MKINLLDVVVKTKNGILNTDFTSTKTLQSHQYLYYNSCHTEHIKNIICNETWRWRRICLEREDLKSHIKDFKGDMLEGVRVNKVCLFLPELLGEFILLQPAAVKILNFWRSKKQKFDQKTFTWHIQSFEKYSIVLIIKQLRNYIMKQVNLQ